MIDRPKLRLIPWLMPIMIVIVAIARPSIARDDGFDDNDEPAPVVQQFMMAEENFDQWVFGGIGNQGATRNRLTSLLALQIADVERACSLSPAQKKTLELAGRGDVKRFFEIVEDKRRKFQLVRNDQQKFQEFYQEVQPLSATVNAGLFGDGSLFQKSIRSTLNPTQQAAFEATERDRRRFQYQAKIERVMSQISVSMGLRVDQRRKLVALLLDETKPPAKFGQYDYHVVLYNMASIPEAKIKPLFDDAQWRVMTRHIQQGKGMEPFLKANGFLPAAILVPAMPAQAVAKPDKPKSR